MPSENRRANRLCGFFIDPRSSISYTDSYSQWERDFKMLIILVSLVVKLEQLDAFLLATLEMGHASLKESGMRRLEVLRQEEDSTRFIVYEAFNTRADYELHLSTDHRKQWLDATASMLTEPLNSTSFTQLFYEIVGQRR